MRNFANYDVDIHGKSSGVLKTICKKCLPTRKNKRDRSLRVNVDTGHCHCYHCGADFYVPDDVEERKMPNVWRPQASCGQPFRSIFSVLCLMPRKPHFPKTRSVGWWRRVVSRSLS